MCQALHLHFVNEETGSESLSNLPKLTKLVDRGINGSNFLIHYFYFLVLFCFVFGLTACGILVPWPGIKSPLLMAPLHQKHRVSATGPPGKSPLFLLLNVKCLVLLGTGCITVHIRGNFVFIHVHVYIKFSLFH